MKNLYIYTLLLLATGLFAQQTPGDKQVQKIVIKGATIHIGNGEVIEDGIIAFSDGKIDLIGQDVMNLPSEYTVQNATGSHIYPSFIAPNTQLGITEIGAVRQTHDFAETGYINPNVRAISAYNAESRVVETTRPNGVLITQSVPKSGLIAGQSAVVQLDAWNWEDAAIRTVDGVHTYWPSSFYTSANKDYNKLKKNYEERVLRLENYLLEAKNYNHTSGNLNLKLDALKGVFDGSKIWYVHTQMANDMLRAIAIKKRLGIPKMVVIGGYDALKIADELKKNNIGVIVDGTHTLPKRPDDIITNNYTLPKRMHEAGILVGLGTYSRMKEMHTRNYPFALGTLVGYGMNKEEALKLGTQNVAKILGIDDNYGTLEVGKSATFFISKGDALDVLTNQLTDAYIDGRKLNLHSFQKDLYNKYRNKYKAQGDIK